MIPINYNGIPATARPSKDPISGETVYRIFADDPGDAIRAGRFVNGTSGPVARALAGPISADALTYYRRTNR